MLLVTAPAIVVLAAVPPGLAGGASGIFTTAQQLGGALLSLALPRTAVADAYE